ncbi:MAG TPA: Ig-like domain-containing protein [Gemmatimonadaceae bacterium]|nr:Ig-like domain-containing protein [Gemmatimonadaceae bacterium]
MAVAAAFLVAACGGGDGPTPPGGPASLTIEPSSDVRLLGVGDTRQLTATPRDSDGNPVSATVTWTSTNPAVATVNSSGLVTATGIGTATVRATAGSVSQDISVTVQQPQFNVNPNSACQSPDLRGFKVEAQSAHLIIVSDVGNPSGGFTSQDYQAFAATFETLLYPVVTSNFGTPADIDGNGKIIAFFTRAVNELTQANSQSVVGGFFFGRDLFPKTTGGGLAGCAGSNVAEMFYLLAPDPTGVVNGNVRTTETVRRITAGVIAHEFQHLINASRRLFINQGAIYPETSYMEEGLSHIAEELVFYEASGLLPRSNLGINDIRASNQRVDAFNSYMISNAARFSNFLRAPGIHSPYQRDDDLETRGAIWAFLRYLADRGAPGSPYGEIPCSSPVALAGPGTSCGIEGSAAQQFTVSAGGAAGEFAIIAFAGNLPAIPGPTPPQVGYITLSASATSTIAFVGPPNPWAGLGGANFSLLGGASNRSVASPVTLDHSIHARLRKIERSELPDRVRGARAMYSLRNASSARMYSAPDAPMMSTAPVEPIWAQLVNSNDTGIVNLRGRFGQDIAGAAQDWAVAHYVDDVGFSSLPPQYTHPSWNFRNLLPWLSTNGATTTGTPPVNTPGTYPLQTFALNTNTTTQVLVDGGALYYRFGLAPATTSTVSFTVGGAAPPSNLKLVIVRTK